jgi:hypothetical protein
VKFPGESHDLSGGHHRHCLGACARKSRGPLDQLFLVLAPATKTRDFLGTPHETITSNCPWGVGVKEAWKNTCQFFLSQTVSQVPYPAIPAATALTVSPPLIQRNSRWLGERGELKVRLTVEQPVIQWWRVGAYRDTTAAHPLVVHRSPDGGPTRRSGLPFETCLTIGATVPTVEPGSFQRSCDPTVKPPLRWWGGRMKYAQRWSNSPRSREVARWCRACSHVLRMALG